MDVIVFLVLGGALGAAAASRWEEQEDSDENASDEEYLDVSPLEAHPPAHPHR